MAGQLGVEHGLEQRSQLEAVVGGDEVDRPAHDDDADDGAVEQQLRQRARVEPVEARPQADVRVLRLLRLQPDEVGDDVERRTIDALEQQLPRQRGSVQGSGRQDHAGGDSERLGAAADRRAHEAGEHDAEAAMAAPTRYASP